MNTEFKCLECGHKFSADKKTYVNCPNCGTDNVSPLSNNYLKYVLFALIFITSVAVGYFVFKRNEPLVAKSDNHINIEGMDSYRSLIAPESDLSSGGDVDINNDTNDDDVTFIDDVDINNDTNEDNATFIDDVDINNDTNDDDVTFIDDVDINIDTNEDNVTFIDDVDIDTKNDSVSYSDSTYINNVIPNNVTVDEQKTVENNEIEVVIPSFAKDTIDLNLEATNPKLNRDKLYSFRAECPDAPSGIELKWSLNEYENEENVIAESNDGVFAGIKPSKNKGKYVLMVAGSNNECEYRGCREIAGFMELLTIAQVQKCFLDEKTRYKYIRGNRIDKKPTIKVIDSVGAEVPDEGFQTVDELIIHCNICNYYVEVKDLGYNESGAVNRIDVVIRSIE